MKRTAYLATLLLFLSGSIIAQKNNSLTINLSEPINKDGYDLNMVNTEKNNTESKKTIGLSDTVFVESKFILPYHKRCEKYKSTIKYNVCNNNYTIYNGDGSSDKKHLIFSDIRSKSKTKKNIGVVFLIQDINTLKYDISVDKSENNYSTEMPELFNIVGDILAGGMSVKTDASINKDSLDLINYISDISRLNKDLSYFFNSKVHGLTCTTMVNFEKEKAAILTRIKSCLGISDYNIEHKYNDLKESAEITNEYIKKYEILLSEGKKITPDELVANTQQLINILLSTSFEYRYIVPQLKNVDELVFTLNINPKKGANGGLQLSNESIVIPIRGGGKIDFTTGFYFSNISNEKYSLSDYEWERYDTTIMMKEINQNSEGKGTIGITALMHAYPRFGTINTGPTFGVGVSPDLNYSLLIGWSLLLGQKNRVALSGGFNYSSVKVLSHNYQEVDGKMLLSNSSTEATRYNTMKPGYFLSLTYSFGLSYKKQENLQ